MTSRGEPIPALPGRRGEDRTESGGRQEETADSPGGRRLRVVPLPEAAGFGPSVVSIGNFDGLHLGHQELFRRLLRAAHRLGAKPSVITFDPHPMCVVAPHRAPALLTTLDRRLTLMEALGVEQVLLIPFTEETARMPAVEFVEQVLVRTAGARAVIVGENFCFGHQGAGNTELLEKLGKQFGFETEAVRGVVYRRHVVSSTTIRGLVQGGDVRMANRMLGRPYGLEGEVVSGDGVGRRKTVPTLNLRTRAEVLPARGVYVTRVTDLDDGRRWDAVSNIGYRPTFGEHPLAIETFILAGYAPPDPVRIRVEFLARLREERKFDDPESLKRQILRDAQRAERYFARTRRQAACAAESI